MQDTFIRVCTKKHALICSRTDFAYWMIGNEEYGQLILFQVVLHHCVGTTNVATGHQWKAISLRAN